LSGDGRPRGDYHPNGSDLTVASKQKEVSRKLDVIKAFDIASPSDERIREVSTCLASRYVATIFRKQSCLHESLRINDGAGYNVMYCLIL